MEFYFAGGAMEVGGSCIYLRIAGHGILMDAGIRQSQNKDPLPDFRGIQEAGGVDVILISHAHMDHTGALPVISSAYPDARIYMTAMTMDLTRVLLYDSLKLMGQKEDGLPQYSENEVKAMFSRIVPVSFQTAVNIFDDTQMVMYPAGHIAGAACIYLTSSEGSVFYSGDVSGFAQQTIEGISIPRLRPDVAILESTYGNRLHAVRSLEEQRLIDVLKECVEQQANVLVPVFALGRSQEVLLIIRKAIQGGVLSPVPVYVDGMVRDMNRVYTMHPTFLKRSLCRRILKGEEPFYTDEIVPVEPRADRNALLEKNGPVILVSSSGMLSGGPSVEYAKKILPMETGCVILTGYQDEEAPGRALLNLLEETQDRAMTLDGLRIPVRARIEMVGLSAHADSSELSGIIEKMAPRHIFLVHGNEEAIAALGNTLSSDFRRKIYQPSDGERITIEVIKKREQWKNDWKFCFQADVFEKEKDAKRLWEAWCTYYPGKAFPLSDIAYLWFGNREISEDGLQDFQQSLLDSIYFDRHPKRMHLIRPCTEEEIAEIQKKGESTPQEVEAVIREILGEMPIRKIGYYPEQKEAVLTVDFPDVFQMDKLELLQKEVSSRTGWGISLKPVVNHQAVQVLLTSLFGVRLKKISYFEYRKEYKIDLSAFEEKDRERIEEFSKTTGWKLTINGFLEVRDSKNENSGTQLIFLPEDAGEITDQNLGMSLIHACFSGKSCAPYKISIKYDEAGKYMELMFLTPALGMREEETIREAARQTGWRIRISGSVNQNALMTLAAELCDRYGLIQKKNPSYLPGTGEVCLRLAPGQEPPGEMIKEFEEKTGARMSYSNK